jgi:alkanesulfonate monooxygenase SsuD/methylene tetrahydromethanopterin reductase-like flavin-dependent oxidoreductase (luciferase family)
MGDEDMKFGVCLQTQNGFDVERFVQAEDHGGPQTGDGVDDRIYDEELRFGDLIEPLGFDSIWVTEHHFSTYTMIPDPIQMLTYFAARTERVDLATMVIVLPWHNPVRVAEQLAMLQHMAGDNRQIMAGFGRGAGRREYGGIGADMTKTRQLFDESVHVVRGLLDNERFAFQGELFQVPNVSMRPESPHLSIRPRPRDGKALTDNFYMAWGSPESMPIAAKLGLKPLIIPQRAIGNYEAELQQYNTLRAEAGYGPANPMVHLHCQCVETDAEARDRIRQEQIYARNAAVNYEFTGDHFEKLPGYESYAARRAARQAAAPSKTLTGIEGPADGSAGLLDWSLTGTPDKIIKAIDEISNWVHPSHMNAVFKYGEMSYEQAEKSLRLFAKEVLPAVHEMKVLDPIVGNDA